MPIALSLLLVLFFLLMNAFFVAAEFSLVRVRKSQVEILVDEGRKGAKYTKLVADNVNAYLSACQLGITLASLALGWLGEPAVSALFEPLFKALNVPEAATHGISIVIGFVIITALHIVVGELIPKSLAIFSTERYALFTATPLVWFYRITYPVMWLFNSITNGVMKMLGHDVANEHEVYTDEEIKLLIDESTESGLIDPEQNEYVDNIFDLGDKDAEAIMTPRTDVVCIDLDDPLEESLQTVLQYKYTRYPVCRGSKDRIVGFVHVKDLYTMPKDATVDDLRVRMIQAVPEGVPIAKLLQTLQEKRTKIAVVIDEHGGTAGIVTMSDIMEQIVGRIDDEYAHGGSDEIVQLDDGSYLIDGSRAHRFRASRVRGMRDGGRPAAHRVRPYPRRGRFRDHRGRRRQGHVHRSRHGPPPHRQDSGGARARSGKRRKLNDFRPRQQWRGFLLRALSHLHAGETLGVVPQHVLQLVLREAGGDELVVFRRRAPHGVVRAEHDAVGAPHARQLHRAALPQEELGARRVHEQVVGVMQDVVAHFIARPATEVRRVHHEVGERFQHVHQAARMRVVVTVVARVDDDGQAPLYHLVHVHESRVVHVHVLRVGMQLHALESQADGAFDFLLGLGIVLVHSHEPDELGMLPALLGDEVVDGLHAARRRGHRMHDEVRDGRMLLRGQQVLHRAFAEHVDEVEVAHGVDRSRGDLVGIYVSMGIDHCHGGAPSRRAVSAARCETASS